MTSMSSTSSGPAIEESNTQSWSLLDEHNVLLSLPDFDPGNISQSPDENLGSLWHSSLYKDHDPSILIDLCGTSHNPYPTDTPSSLYGSHKANASNYSAEMQQQIESDMQLSQLNIELCRQLHTHLHRPTTTSDNSVQTLCPGISEALGGVLQSTKAYIHILQGLSNCAELHPDSASTTSPPTLPFLCVLNLTSCFFRIVDLFNILLSNLALELLTHSLSPSPSSSSSAATPTLQILPELNLAGLPVHEVSLQIKILLLAITHHFETMERLLGMPVELRVSECGNDNIYGLLSASWTDMLSAGKRERCELGWGGTGNWVRSVESLRENIGGLTRVC
ncbi:hypothetical protein P3342_009655 [Pyrenophora teres f. teres]|nr:hypothetical protein P3342_009655 [Pyrenophora teres f. teres]